MREVPKVFLCPKTLHIPLPETDWFRRFSWCFRFISILNSFVKLMFLLCAAFFLLICLCFVAVVETFFSCCSFFM